MKKDSNYYAQLARLQSEAEMNISHLDEQGAPQMNVDNGQVEAAQFDVIVKRLTANIDEVLPVPLFGAANLESGLQNSIGSYLESSATSLVAIQYGNVFISTGDETMTPNLTASNKLRLQFKNGANLDIVEVTCTSVPYPQFVMSTFSDIFTLSKMRITISDGTKTEQFSNAMEFTRKSIFGKALQNPLGATAFSSPFQQRTDIIDVNISDNVDKESTVWTSIIPIEGFKVTYSIFVQRFSKLSARF